MFCLSLMNEPPFVYLAIDLACEVWWLDCLLKIVESWGTKVVFARLAPQVSLYELGSVLFCVRLLESRRTGGKRIGCVLIEFTSFPALHPHPSYVGLVSKKYNFLADGVDVIQTDLTGDDQTKTWFFQRLEDTVSNPRSPCCFMTSNLLPCLEH